MKNKIIKMVFLVCFIVILLDQGTKFFAEKYIINTGMALGINEGNTQNIFITLVVLLTMISFLRKQQKEIDTKTTFAIALAMGGGISNLMDRIFRGGILDFISIWKFPKFNIADICVCVAWILLIVFLVLYTNKKDVIEEIDPEELKIKEKK